MLYEEISQLAAQYQLQILGGFFPNKEDAVPENTTTLLLLGPLEPDFWTYFENSDEFQDGAPNPLDRWSTRTIGQLATSTSAISLFPFGGPPYLPFTKWAIKSLRCWESPIGLLVHDTAGLLVSYRGALALPERIDLPPVPPQSPCLSCDERPCIGSCPINALNEFNFDSKSCFEYIDKSEGEQCLMQGCNVRRACPISKTYPRSQRLSQFHQEALLGRRISL